MRNACVFYSPPPREERLPLFWSGMGEEERRSTNYVWNGLRRGRTDCHLVWQLTLSGRGRIRIGSNPAVAVEAGQGFMALFPGDHCYYYQKGDPAWHFIWVSWTGPSVRSIWEALSPAPACTVDLAVNAPSIGFVRSLISSRSAGAAPSRSDSSESFRLLLELTQGSLPASGRSRRPAEVLPRLNGMVRRHPDMPVGKDGMASRLGLSRFQLYRDLKEEVGMGPKEWALRRRLDQAFHLLRDTSMPVSEIAVRVGMADANYFARFFRNQTGFAPRDWRKLFASAA